MLYYYGNRGVAQSGRVLGSGPRGRWFESSHSDVAKTLEIVEVSRVFSFFGFGDLRRFST